MTYAITGLDPAPFRALHGLADAALAERHMVRRTADSPNGYPCRVTLEDAAPGERLILLNHVSHDAATPFRTAYAIYVREGVEAAPTYTDCLPPMVDRRTVGLRGFDGDGMLAGALLALPGEADAKLRVLFDRPDLAAVHIHNAAYGCFLAAARRN